MKKKENRAERVDPNNAPQLFKSYTTRRNIVSQTLRDSSLMPQSPDAKSAPAACKCIVAKMTRTTLPQCLLFVDEIELNIEKMARVHTAPWRRIDLAISISWNKKLSLFILILILSISFHIVSDTISLSSQSSLHLSFTLLVRYQSRCNI